MVISSLCLRDEPADHELHILQSVLLIEDAENFRKIKKMDITRLKTCKLYYSRAFNYLVDFAIIVLLILPFFEWPSSLTLNSDVRFNNHERPKVPCVLLVSSELISLFILTMEAALCVYLFGVSYLIRDKWLCGQVIVLCISIIDASIFTLSNCNDVVSIRRFLRPYFLLNNSLMMKALFRCLHRTLSELMSTFFLLSAWIFSATLVSMCIFSTPTDPDDCDIEGCKSDEAFDDFYDTLFSFLVLLTTANNPDVMQSAYNENRFAALFFIIYLSVGLYVFMNILTVIIFDKFRGYLSLSGKSRILRRRLAVRAAFEKIKKQDEQQKPYVSSHTVSLIVSKAELPAWKKAIIQQRISVEFENLDFDLTHFMELFRSLDVGEPLREKDLVTHLAIGPKLAIMQKFLRSTSFISLTYLISIAHLMHTMVQLTKIRDIIEGLVVNTVFVIWYVIEQSLLVWALGYKVYFAQRHHMFDFVLTFLSVVFKFVEIGIFIWRKSIYDADPSRADNGSNQYPVLEYVMRFGMLLVLIRSLRIVRLFSGTRLITSYLFELPTILRPILGLLASVYYFYAVLGMYLFQGAINYTNGTMVTELNGSIALLKPEYPCGSYQQLEYWSINFDDFASSLIVLWDLMVVNNWHVIVNMFEINLGRWVRVYMISWWILTVIILLTVGTACIIETFLFHRTLYENARQKAHSDITDVHPKVSNLNENNSHITHHRASTSSTALSEDVDTPKITKTVIPKPHLCPSVRSTMWKSRTQFASLTKADLSLINSIKSLCDAALTKSKSLSGCSTPVETPDQLKRMQSSVPPSPSTSCPTPSYRSRSFTMESEKPIDVESATMIIQKLMASANYIRERSTSNISPEVVMKNIFFDETEEDALIINGLNNEKDCQPILPVSDMHSNVIKFLEKSGESSSTSRLVNESTIQPKYAEYPIESSLQSPTYEPMNSEKLVIGQEIDDETSYRTQSMNSHSAEALIPEDLYQVRPKEAFRPRRNSFAFRYSFDEVFRLLSGSGVVEPTEEMLAKILETHPTFNQQ